MTGNRQNATIKSKKSYIMAGRKATLSYFTVTELRMNPLAFAIHAQAKAQ